eukprot:CAMPEP_0115651520 /NCGR_PEP_ID=MMETSP0272-20121206/41591_1 /TAXON_ID=71861 /ORGANISM="Scrippsiella trochoidea, Strain CCMP3099" /LENGTH=57 /DNA_ID=CAMNT_0003089287 /DNA_START=171 /DNA_END=342 /DNA_ORIENTATION=+
MTIATAADPMSTALLSMKALFAARHGGEVGRPGFVRGARQIGLGTLPTVRQQTRADD